METYWDDLMERDLRRYIALVTQAMGLHGECSYVQIDEHACAYIAVDGRLRRFPGRDVALLWDDVRGWSAAIETHSGEDLLVVAHLDEDVLPPPHTVANWVRTLFHPRPIDQATRTNGGRHRTDTRDLRRRLAAYASPHSAVTIPDG